MKKHHRRTTSIAILGEVLIRFRRRPTFRAMRYARPSIFYRNILRHFCKQRQTLRVLLSTISIMTKSKLYMNFCVNIAPTLSFRRAQGRFHGFAYGSYCKVLNLAHTHWCFRRRPNKLDIQYPPASNPQLRHSLHVPLDEKVLGGVGSLIDNGELPHFVMPRGGMGSVKTRDDYIAIQNYLRDEADKIKSTNFPGSNVSPLSFEGFWTR